MNTKSIISLLLLQVTLLGMVGCGSYEPIDPPYNDIPPGPGILSGKKGAFEIDLDR